ncbi:unnamed protein product [Clonostachys rosea f. rosea IK726]|uniref:Ribosome biogenesis protein ALB1 n=2 Tax=Bionectria ochroleuca TaxID=29856 RepID=A0A0B7K3S2_BIOOC|nr:unnamed protein product [Clonostachys rosea f. rosea IK726]
MPSVKNPNGMSKIRAAARSLKAKKAQRQISEQNKNKISRKDVARGARPGLLPNSGPRAKLSGKKARKLEKKMGYALKRKMDAEGIVEMTDVVETDAKADAGESAAAEDMEIQ